MSSPRAPLDRLFAPATIALVGVSRRRENLGNRYLRHLLAHGFPRDSLFLVHPSAGEIEGVAAVPTVAELPVAPDAAVLLTAGRVTLELLEALDRRGAGGVNILSDAAEVTAEAAAIRAVLGRRGMPLLGPNSPGYVVADPPVAANASHFLARQSLRSGPVAIASQSGAIAGIVADRLLAAGAGLDLLFCTGNELDLTAGDCLRYALAQPRRPRALGAFLEMLRPHDPFLDVVEEAAAAGVSSFVLKAGRTEAGRAAARAHGGGSDGWERERAEQRLAAAGAVLCRDVDELFVSLLVANLPPPAGAAIALCCTSGGLSGVFADLAVQSGFELAPLAGPNPWDTGIEVIDHPDRVGRKFASVLAESAVDCGLLALSTQPDEVISRLFESLAANPSEKPFLVVPVAPIQPEAAALLAGSGGAVVANPVQGLAALAAGLATGAGLG
jgi:acyl-CoA synthetase (NDP forming)